MPETGSGEQEEKNDQSASVVSGNPDRLALSANFDFNALAERLLALMKQEARVERERLGVKKVRDGR